MVDDKHKDARNAASLRYHKRQRANNPVKYLLIQAKTRCKKHGIPFNLTIDDLTIPTHCPILGYELNYLHTRVRNSKGGNPPNLASLDRIIPALGYVPDNVIIVSLRANVLKNDATIAEMEAILKFYKRLRN